MTLPILVAVGEAMIEMAPVDGGLFRIGFAGDTFNTLWHAAQLLRGRATARYVTRIGSDLTSDRFAAELVADGIDASGLGRDLKRTMGLYLIELDGVERRFQYWRSDSAARGLADDPEALAQSLSGAGLIHVSGITLAILSPSARDWLFAALAGARDRGARIAFDPNLRPRLWSSAAETRATFTRMLRLTDIALPSFDDEVALWGDASPEATALRFQAAGVAEVAIKNGHRPVTLMREGKVFDLPTPEVAGIVDTTGAGDAFNAGYLSARLMGQATDIAVGQGQRLAALVLQGLGARAPREAVRALGTAPADI